MTGCLQMLMIVALRTGKSRNSLIMSELPPPPQVVDYQVVTCLRRSYMIDIQSVNINRLPLSCLINRCN
jgi:hypothetical protein